MHKDLNVFSSDRFFLVITEQLVASLHLTYIRYLG